MQKKKRLLQKNVENINGYDYNEAFTNQSNFSTK